MKYLREQTTRFYRETSAANRNGDDSEIPMRHWLVRRINYRGAFLWQSNNKKSTYRQISLRYHAQFWSLLVVTLALCKFRARDCFVVTLLASWNDIFRLALLPHHVVAFAELNAARREQQHRKHRMHALIFDTYGFVLYSRKIANVWCIKTIRA